MRSSSEGAPESTMEMELVLDPSGAPSERLTWLTPSVERKELQVPGKPSFVCLLGLRFAPPRALNLMRLRRNLLSQYCALLIF